MVVRVRTQDARERTRECERERMGGRPARGRLPNSVHKMGYGNMFYREYLGIIFPSSLTTSKLIRDWKPGQNQAEGIFKV